MCCPQLPSRGAASPGISKKQLAATATSFFFATLAIDFLYFPSFLLPPLLLLPPPSLVHGARRPFDYIHFFRRGKKRQMRDKKELESLASVTSLSFFSFFFCPHELPVAHKFFWGVLGGKKKPGPVSTTEWSAPQGAQHTSVITAPAAAAAPAAVTSSIRRIAPLQLRGICLG